MSDFILERLIKIIYNNWKMILFIILLLNLVLRLFIYSSTTLFYFSDYQAYLGAVDRIHTEGNIPIVGGNFLFTISYLGYYAKYLLGSIDYFYFINCLLGTMTTYILSILIIKLSGNVISGVFTALILTLYTEFMVFSSVFYTPIIMLFLLSLFIFLLYNYYKTTSIPTMLFQAFLIILIYIFSFLFKPELVFFPIFLGLLAFIFIRKDRSFFIRNLFLALSLVMGFMVFNSAGIYGREKGSVIANDFVFFGHTNYGGDGGEGSFVYSTNKIRYETTFAEYCNSNGINHPTLKQRNNFQLLEIKKFITQHPFKWVGLQFTKFFRTFGVVPETTSFKVLYTGLLKGTLWLTSIVVVAPVALIILLFILFFNHSAIVLLIKGSTAQRRNGTMALQPDDITTQELAGSQLPITDHRSPITDYHDSNKTGFLYIYLLLFVYYIIATIFFGQYQERYRLPLMVIFIIPTLGYFIASFNKQQFLKKSTLIIKSSVIVLFLSIWTFQAIKAISNKERLKNAIELVQDKR